MRAQMSEVLPTPLVAPTYNNDRQSRVFSLLKLCVELLDEANGVAVCVFHVHFAAAPGLIHGRHINADVFGEEFLVQVYRRCRP